MYKNILVTFPSHTLSYLSVPPATPSIPANPFPRFMISGLSCDLYGLIRAMHLTSRLELSIRAQLNGAYETDEGDSLSS